MNKVRKNINEGAYQEIENVLKSSRNLDDLIPVFANTFKLSEDAIKIGLSKDLKTLQRDLNTGIGKDIKSGVNVTNGNILGTNAKTASKLITMKEILESKRALTEADIIAIIERNRNNSKQIARKIEAVKASKTAKTEPQPQQSTVTASGEHSVAINGNNATINQTINHYTAAQELSKAGEIKDEIGTIAKTNGESVSRMGKNTFEKLKSIGKRLNKRWLWKLGLLGAAGGVGLYALGKFVLGGNTNPSSPENQPLTDCFNNALNQPNATALVTKTGDPVVHIKNTGNQDYDSKGGILLYNNGRVFLGNKSRRGSYSCNSSKITMSEQVSGIGNINIVWDDQKNTTNNQSTNNTQPTVQRPVQNKMTYTPCNDMPFKYGCKSDKIKEVQMKLGLPSKYQTGNFGPITFKALQDKGFDMSGKVITQDIYNQLLGQNNTVPKFTPDTNTPDITDDSQQNNLNVNDHGIVDTTNMSPEEIDKMKKDVLQNNINEIKIFMKKLIK